MNYLTFIVNGETGEELVRELTETEILELKEAQKEAGLFEDKHQQEQAEKESARNSALAKLADLGLTEEEAKAIIGI